MVAVLLARPWYVPAAHVTQVAELSDVHTPPESALPAGHTAVHDKQAVAPLDGWYIVFRGATLLHDRHEAREVAGPAVVL